MDPHPHLGVAHASIHPCKHASVMKKIVDMSAGVCLISHSLFFFPPVVVRMSCVHVGWCLFVQDNGDEKSPAKAGSTPAKSTAAAIEDRRVVAVDQYMFLFLKFISSVIPTIEYDYTLSA